MPHKPTGVGTRREVWDGRKRATSGGLTKKDLKEKNGRLVSKEASAAAAKRFRSKKRVAGYANLKEAFAANRAEPFGGGKKKKSKKTSKKRSAAAKKRSSSKAKGPGSCRKGYRWNCARQQCKKLGFSLQN